MVNHIAIIGLGFTGSSLGLAFKQSAPDTIVTGIDKASIIIQAKDIGAIDNGCLFSELEFGVKDADIVFFATPIQNTIKLLPKVSTNIKKNTIVTDTGITKLEITRVAKRHFKEDAVFIGGHPIIGYQRGGHEQADPYLFVNNTYVLTPISKDRPEALEVLKKVIQDIGGKTLVMSAEEHDDLSSGLNHILQLMALAHVNAMLTKIDKRKVDVDTAIALASERFKQFTEALLTPSYFWDEIFNSNEVYIKKNIEDFILELKKLIGGLSSELLPQKYERAKQYIMKMPKTKKGFSKSLSHLYVIIEDKPGSIAKLTSLIASQDFDIKDIGVVKIKEGEAATIRISFSDQNIASKVGSYIVKHGYRCRSQFDYEEFSI
jgi:prephenate dehydrogenase